MISEYARFSELLDDPKIENRTAVVYDAQSYTYGELRSAVELCASDLMARGVKPGDHVGLWSYNSINWIIAMFAIIRVGGVAVLANYNMTGEFAAPLLDYADVRFLVYGLNRDTHQDSLAGEKLAKAIGCGGKTYCFAETDYKARLERGERPAALPEEDRDPNRDAVIIFTTGTTAMPKAVLLSQKSVLNNAVGAFHHLKQELDKHDSCCISLPLFHSYGLTVMVGAIMIGKTTHLISRLKPEEIINTISKYHTGMLCCVSLLVLGMISSERFKGEVAPYLRMCVLGGEFADAQQIIRMNNAYPDIAIIVGYGQTEAGPIISLNQPNDTVENRAHTVGTVLDGTKIRIVDPQSGELRAQGEVGEVQIQSDSLMNGYYKIIPEKQAIGADGWLRTGDLGYMDESNHLHLTDRLKNIIIKNGENISPSEIEKGLLRCEGVKQACVIGAPSPICGEEIEACLTMMDGYRFNENAIRTQLMKYIIKFKMPEHFFIYDTFPMNDSGKVSVRELRKNMLNRMKNEKKC